MEDYERELLCQLCHRPYPAWSRQPLKGRGVVPAGQHSYRGTRKEVMSRSFDEETKTSEVVHSRTHTKHHLA